MSATIDSHKMGMEVHCRVGPEQQGGLPGLNRTGSGGGSIAWRGRWSHVTNQSQKRYPPELRERAADLDRVADEGPPRRSSWRPSPEPNRGERAQFLVGDAVLPAQRPQRLWEFLSCVGILPRPQKVAQWNLESGGEAHQDPPPGKGSPARSPRHAPW